MRALKAFVIVMAIVMVAGIAVVVVTIVDRSREMAERGAVEAALPAPADGPRGFDRGRVAIPEGGRIVEMIAEGERLVLRLRLTTGAEQLVFIDMASGETIGRLDLVWQAP